MPKPQKTTGPATGLPDADVDRKVSKRLIRRLAELEQEMRRFLPGFTRVPQIETKNQVSYFIKLMETFLNADSGTFHDEMLRQLILDKLRPEYYVW